MIQTGGQKLFTATEVSLLLGVTRETLGLYAKEAEIPDRRILRVRYYTEEEIRKVLETQGQKPTRRVSSQMKRGCTMTEKDFYSLSLEEKEKFVQRESLPGRKEHLQTLRGIRETLLSKLEGLESLVSSTLLFETEEETLLLGSIRSLQTALSRLDSSISLLENNIQRVEDGESNNL